MFDVLTLERLSDQKLDGFVTKDMEGLVKERFGGATPVQVAQILRKVLMFGDVKGALRLAECFGGTCEIVGYFVTLTLEAALLFSDDVISDLLQRKKPFTFLDHPEILDNVSENARIEILLHLISSVHHERSYTGDHRRRIARFLCKQARSLPTAGLWAILTATSSRTPGQELLQLRVQTLLALREQLRPPNVVFFHDCEHLAEFRTLLSERWTNLEFEALLDMALLYRDYDALIMIYRWATLWPNAVDAALAAIHTHGSQFELSFSNPPSQNSKPPEQSLVMNNMGSFSPTSTPLPSPSPTSRSSIWSSAPSKIRNLDWSYCLESVFQDVKQIDEPWDQAHALSLVCRTFEQMRGPLKLLEEVMLKEAETEGMVKVYEKLFFDGDFNSSSLDDQALISVAQLCI